MPTTRASRTHGPVPQGRRSPPPPAPPKTKNARGLPTNRASSRASPVKPAGEGRNKGGLGWAAAREATNEHSGSRPATADRRPWATPERALSTPGAARRRHGPDAPPDAARRARPQTGDGGRLRQRAGGVLAPGRGCRGGHAAGPSGRGWMGSGVLGAVQERPRCGRVHGHQGAHARGWLRGWLRGIDTASMAAWPAWVMRQSS